ncbi:MAG: hypothetical protein H6659_18805 [Ardenticatenaceae bacterium]|nr:hypothetical protein [Anaerolineales bacterium]MCB8985886.1 hypothetical protein [Ardenticatenaceae bacterium]
MKTAKTTEGKEIVAAPDAPEEALCPYCGGIVVLRRRRTMNKGEVAYYYRHRSNHNTQCSARRRPIG